MAWNRPRAGTRVRSAVRTRRHAEGQVRERPSCVSDSAPVGAAMRRTGTSERAAQRGARYTTPRRRESIRAKITRTSPHNTPRAHRAAPTRIPVDSSSAEPARCSSMVLPPSPTVTWGSTSAFTSRGEVQVPSLSECDAPAALSIRSRASTSAVMILVINNRWLSISKRCVRAEEIISTRVERGPLSLLYGDGARSLSRCCEDASRFDLSNSDYLPLQIGNDRVCDRNEHSAPPEGPPSFQCYPNAKPRTRRRTLAPLIAPFFVAISVAKASRRRTMPPRPHKPPSSRRTYLNPTFR